MRKSLALAVTAMVALAGCSSDDPADSELNAMVSHYPVQFLVEQVGGDLVQVETLTSPGAEPHDLELSPQQVGQVQDAATVFYLSGFQPAIDDVVPEANGTVVDLTAGLALRDSDDYGSDPHVWLDPQLMAQMASTVADTLSAADPQNRTTFEANAQALQSDLNDLDQEWRRATASCEIRTMVVSHEAFGYLADRYGFDQKGIAGLNPETEPSAQAIAELAEFVRDNDVTTVYTEILIDPAVSQTIAAEAGAQTATLDPLEGPPVTGDYLSAMRENLQTVMTGQRCS